MTNSPEPAFAVSSRSSDTVPWWWQLLDADGKVIEQESRAEFPTRSDAETWLGEAYADLAAQGVA